VHRSRLVAIANASSTTPTDIPIVTNTRCQQLPRENTRSSALKTTSTPIQIMTCCQYGPKMLLERKLHSKTPLEDSELQPAVCALLLCSHYLMQSKGHTVQANKHTYWAGVAVWACMCTAGGAGGALSSSAMV
jgi:hypothetical protein